MPYKLSTVRRLLKKRGWVEIGSSEETNDYIFYLGKTDELPMYRLRYPDDEDYGSVLECMGGRQFTIEWGFMLFGAKDFDYLDRIVAFTNQMMENEPRYA